MAADTTPPNHDDPLHGTPLDQPFRIRDYEVFRSLGEGSFATTYLARHRKTLELAAIKSLQLIKAGHRRQVELFEREVRALQALDHPQIPSYYGTAILEGSETFTLYIIQEYVAGRSLAQIVDEDGPMSGPEVVEVLASCLEPLRYLHGLTPPLFHRDLKPSNIIRRADRTCCLVDFGAVREAIADPKGAGSSIIGTFGYMAPEQFQARIYPASDLYSLGATAVFLLTGISPERMESRRLKPDIHRHVVADTHLSAILDLLLEPAAEDRYQTVDALGKALDRWRKRQAGAKTSARAAFLKSAPTEPLPALPEERKPEAKPKAEPKPEAKPKAEPKPEAKPKAEPKPEPKAEPKPKPKPEPEPAPKAEAKPDPKPQAQRPSGGDGKKGRGKKGKNKQRRPERAAGPATPPATGGAAASAAPDDSSPGASGSQGKGKDGGRGKGKRETTDESAKLPIRKVQIPFGQVFVPGVPGGQAMGAVYLIAAVVLAGVTYTRGLALPIYAVAGALALYGLAYLLVGARGGSTAPASYLDQTDGELVSVDLRSSPLGPRDVLLRYRFEHDGKTYQGAQRFPSREAARPYLRRTLPGMVHFDETDPRHNALGPPDEE